MRHTWILCAALTAAACGDANTNDFMPSDNILRLGSEGHDCKELRELRAQGLPATIEEAEHAPTGLLLRVENALQWPRGARDVATVVHLNVRLCGSQEKKTSKGEKYQEMVNCHELVGTVNQDEQETFYMTAGEALAVVKDNDKGYEATLQYKLTSQVSALWYQGGRVTIKPSLDQGKQSVDVRVVEARHMSYYDQVQNRFVARSNMVAW